VSERPPSVPEQAVWDAGDGEWVLAERDDDGRKHGQATYWRPDGTLVNHCSYEHGVPHGLAVRYTSRGDALAVGRAQQALEFCDRAIAIEFHYGPCAARAAKVTALRQLGRDDEAFETARGLLTADPDAPGLDDIRADPAFVAWLESIRTDTMTVEGAW
jgi:hypothetical protein